MRFRGTRFSRHAISRHAISRHAISRVAQIASAIPRIVRQISFGMIQ